MAKTSSKGPVYIAAALDELRLFSERAQIVDTRERKARAQLKVQATTQATIGAALSATTPEGGVNRLSINHGYRVDIVSVDGNEPLCEYESDYRANFSVTALFGVDPSKQIPVSVIETYINQVAWVVRTRAQGTLGQMGLGGIVLPRPDYKEASDTSSGQLSGGVDGGTKKVGTSSKQRRRS